MLLRPTSASLLRRVGTASVQARSRRPTMKSFATSSASKGNDQLVFEGTEDNFDEIVVESKIPVVVDIKAEWCPPCKMLGPILEKEIEALQGKVRLVKVDSDEQPNLARSLRVTSLPTVIAVHQGKAVDMFVGFPGNEKVKEFVDKIAALSGSK